jgi:sugar/nucleoside kinase (ribokinase family)
MQFLFQIGRDETGKILEEKARAAGVNVRYQYSDKYPTGR